MMLPDACAPATNSVAAIVPSLNAGPLWKQTLAALRAQVPPVPVVVLDSQSSDATVTEARENQCVVHTVERARFDHGATRQWGASLVDAEIVVYLTQDAVLLDEHAIARLVAVFADPTVGAAYGRQVPRRGAGAIEAHARLFNYPSRDYRVTPRTVTDFGIKAPFLSNSFAAYRRRALDAIGGFPSRVIVSEDMHVGARLLDAGWSLAYVPDACVEHSHGYRLPQEFRRYFDLGVFHAEESWIQQRFGRAGGEGARYVRSEVHYLLRRAPWRIPESLVRNAIKLLAFRLGLLHQQLPHALKLRLSAHRNFWRAADAPLAEPCPSGQSA